VLGVLIARASGRSFEAFLHERIFTPLGMKDTAFSAPPAKLERLASCYSFDPGSNKLVLADGQLGLSIVTKPDVVAAPPGRYGWNGGLGTTWWSDPKEDMVAIIMTQRMFESPDPPKVCRDFWSSAYQAIDD
jgi:CubicO group peptidase (beta-lactamase class C family)